MYIQESDGYFYMCWKQKMQHLGVTVLELFEDIFNIA